MKLSDAELVAFRDRCHKAAVRGYQVAHAGLYLEALADETGESEPPVGAAKGSAAHLAAMAQATLDVRSGKKSKAKPAKKEKVAPAPKPSKPKAAPKPPPPPEPEEDEDEEDEELGYEDWGRDELYAEAQAREIPGRSNMSKEELVEALYANDEEQDE